MELPPTFIDGWSDIESIKQMKYKRFGQTDMFISTISFGAAHVKNNDGCINNNETIYEAIRMGINLIDTSPFYGMGTSETIVGQALKNIPRKAYYLSTKVGRHSDCRFDYSAEAIRKSIENSLIKLNVTYLDIVHIHDVEFCSNEQLLQKTLPELEKLRNEKKIRYIGISGYPLNILKEIVDKSIDIKIDIILSYCRYSLWDNELINYLDYFKSKNIGIINAAIFGMGLLGQDSLRLPEWHPASEIIRNQCKMAREICMEKNTPIARLALKYSLLEKRIDTHLIGMESLDIVKLNFSIIKDSDYDNEEIKLIDLLLKEAFQKSDGIHSTTNNNNWENVELNRYRKNPEQFEQFLRQCWSQK